MIWEVTQIRRESLNPLTLHADFSFEYSLLEIESMAAFTLFE